MKSSSIKRILKNATFFSAFVALIFVIVLPIQIWAATFNNPSGVKSADLSPTPAVSGSPSSPAIPAQSGSPISQVTDVNSLATRLVSIGTLVEYLLVAFAVLYIIWSVVMYFIKGTEGDESRRAAGMRILWGIVGLAIILSLWGLVNIILQSFGTNTTPPNQLPNANFLTNPSGQ